MKLCWTIIPAAVVGLILWIGLIGIVLAEPIYTVKWTTPTVREDGTTLYNSEIAGYRVRVDGIPIKRFRVWGAVEEVSFDFGGTQFDDGLHHTITLETIDSEFRLSDYSNSVGVPVTNPTAPGICLK